MSTLTGFDYIAERSQATPGLFNRILSTLSDNIRTAAEDHTLSGATYTLLSANTLSIFTNLDVARHIKTDLLSVGSTPTSTVTQAHMIIAAHSGGSDYIQFTDSSAARSSYLLGSHAGGTADGLNLWDISGNTMLVSFSKQSIRFYQQVVGPVFDLGGALTGTYNAATFGTAADSDESRIQAAINQASIDGIPRVYVPQSMLPYSASSISFIYPVMMIREGGNAAVDDVLAYGASGTSFPTEPTASSTSAIQAAVWTGRPVDFVGLVYKASNISQIADDQVLLSSTGVARIIKNANGPIISASGDRLILNKLELRGEAASPSFTSHNFVCTGDHLSLVECASQWANGRAIKATGAHTTILGTCGIYQTAEIADTAYDIELGISGTATLYHQIVGCYTSQASGGILLIDVGGVGIQGSQFGKLSVMSGTLPAGTGGIMVVGNRINSRTSIQISNTVLDANSLNSDVIFSGSVSGCRYDVSNVIASGSRVSAHPPGNANNFIMREMSAGGTSDIKFGDDTSVATLKITHSSGEFEFPGIVRMQNNTGIIRFKTAAGGDGTLLNQSAGNVFNISNPTSNSAIDYTVTGASSAHRFNVNGTERVRISASSISAQAIWAHSGISVGNSTAGGTLIPAISSVSSKIAAFVVQGSASSFTVVTWTAAQPGDQILTTIFPDAAVSSLSSGLVLHSHCTQAGQIEVRLSNVSTLAQNQSSKTYYFTRISPF